MLEQRLEVLERGACLVEVGREDEVVGGLADTVLLGTLQLGGADVLERLDDAPVGLGAIRSHLDHVIVSLRTD